jgi:hypothetical protein
MEGREITAPKAVFLAESDRLCQIVPSKLFAPVYSISPMGLGRLLLDSQLRLDS